MTADTEVLPRKKSSMLPTILIVIVAIIVVFLIVVAMQPDQYSVSRSATISGPAADVFAQVNDLHKFQDWSPWAKIDPDVKNTYEGPASGAGAICKWVGNKKVGEGVMTIAESKPNDSIGMKLEFIKPFASKADVQFNFKQQANQTAVTWSMSGKNNFMAKAFCLFMNMDKMIGGDFERGLANLKSLVENQSKAAK
jgi:hypothetical protein